MPDALLAELNTALPLRKISEQIDRLPLSADIKALLLDLAKVTVKVGAAVLKIGAKVLSVIFDISARFPSTAFGLVVAVCVGLLIGATPVIGAVLGPFLMPLLMAFGLAKGAIADFSGEAWAGAARDLSAKLATVSA